MMSEKSFEIYGKSERKLKRQRLTAAAANDGAQKQCVCSFLRDGSLLPARFKLPDWQQPQQVSKYMFSANM
jgi:hypothetical protein